MSKVLLVLASVIALCACLEYKSSVDYYSYPKYEFRYGVHDPHTKDFKERSEYRDGDLVKQEYTWGEKDREVKVFKVDSHVRPVERGYKYY